MTSGKIMSNRKISYTLFCFFFHFNKFLLFCFFICAFYSAISFAQDFSQQIDSTNNDQQLQKLLASHKQKQHIKLPYIEKRYSIFLKKPREFHGYIEYIKPDIFIKQIDSPMQKKFILKENQLIIHSFKSEKNKTKKTSENKVSLENYPQFKQLKALFSGLLKGDITQLNQYYHYELNFMSDSITHLELKNQMSNPFTQEQQNVHQNIKIIFVKQQIKKIIMTGFGGEKSELTFDPSYVESAKVDPKEK
jgi:hypothetical protein